ncbi:hypothetical protein BgAZ_100390 [Babesia gibsoni]|uniref:50S ribosomal protein L33 n=1 Tax=Babesia gibsoni TaxID=33632 RepID=A0AAD8UUN0_BABGI|nr:hypothetical protein BgAZ_100390 [Babesia gibsoni]
MGVRAILRAYIFLLLLEVCVPCFGFRLVAPGVSDDVHSYTDSRFSVFAKRRKSARILVTLECTEARKLGLPPSRYYTSKNKVNTPERLELMKYNKYLRRHTLHKEIK